MSEAKLPPPGQRDLASILAARNAASEANDSGDARLRQVQALDKMAQNKRGAIKIAKNKEAINTLLSGLKEKPRFVKLVDYSIECMKNLAVDEVSVEELIDEGTLDSMKNVLKVYPYNEDLQVKVNRALQKYAYNPRLAALTVEKFGTDNLVHSLTKHNNSETQIETCNTIKQLMSGGPDVVKKFAAGGVIDALKALKNNAGLDNPALTAALAETATLLAQNGYWKELEEAGITEWIVEVAVRHKGNADLAKCTVQFIEAVAKADQGAAAFLKDKMNILEALSSLTAEHPNLGVMIEAAKGALSVLSDAKDVEVSVLEVKTANTDNEKAVSMAMLTTLTLVEKNVETIVEIGGIGVVLHSVQVAQSQSATQTAGSSQSDLSLSIVENGCRALERLAEVSTNNSYSIIRDGGAKLLVGVVNGNVNNEKVSSAAIGALAKLAAGRQEDAEYIIKIKGNAVANAAVLANPKSSEVGRQYLELAQKTTQFPALIPALADTGSIDVVVELLKNHIGDEAIVASSLKVLAALSDSKSHTDRIVTCGALPFVVEALNIYTNNPSVSTDSLRLFETFAAHPEHVPLMRSMHAMESIVSTMDAHPKSDSLKESGVRILASFASPEQLLAVVDNVGALVDQLNAAKSSASQSIVLGKMVPALGLLASLTVGSSNIAVLNQGKAAESLVRTLEALAKLPPSEERNQLLRDTVKCLEKLASDPEVAQYLVNSGALNLLLDLIKQAPDAEDLLEAVTGLAAAIFAHEKVIPVGAQTGVLDGIIEAAAKYPSSGGVLNHARKIVEGYITHHQAITSSTASIMVEVTLNAADRDDLLRSLDMIENLVTDDQSAQQLIDNGAVAAVLDTLKRHPNDPNVQVAAMRALRKLMTNEAVMKMVAKAGGLDLTVAPMRTLHTYEAVIEASCALLDAFSQVGSLARELIEVHGAVELCQWAASSYGANGNIMQYTQNCLSRFSALVVAGDSSAVVNNLVAPELSRAELLTLLDQVTSILKLDDVSAAKMFVQQDGMSALSKAILVQKADADILARGGAIIQSLVSRSDDLKGELVAKNLPELVEALIELVTSPGMNFDQVNLRNASAACQLLADLANTPENAQHMLPVLRPLFDILSASAEPALLEHAARVLAKLSNDNEGLRLISNVGSIKQLLEAMRKHKDQPDFLRHAVYLLGNIALNDQLKVQIGALGGIQVLMELMELHPLHRPLIENCNYALANLSYNNEINMGLIVASNGIHNILASMTNHPTAEELLESAMCTLSNLCFRSDANKELIVKHGGAKCIVDSVLANFNAESLVSTGFRALGNLAFYTPNIPIIVQEGGVQSIVAGLMEHGKNVGLVQIAIQVLTNLSSVQDANCSRIIAQEGAVQAVVEVVHHLFDNPEVVVPAITCLYNLCKVESNSTVVVRQQGVKYVTQSMRALAFDSELLLKSLRLLKLLSAFPTNINRMLLDEPVVAIAQVLNSEAVERKNKEVAAEGLAALNNLAATDESANAVATQGGVSVTLNVITALIDQVNMVMEGLRTLGTLTRTERNANAASEKAMKVISSSLSYHASDARYVAFATSFLANLAIFQLAAEAVVSTELVTQLLTLARQYIEDGNTVQRILRALENMALASNTVKKHMRDQGAVESLMLLQGAVFNPDTRKAISNVIDAIERLKLTAKPVLGNVGARSAKAIFGEETEVPAEEEDAKLNLPEDVRNYLTAGALLQKHSMTAPPRPRHVFVSPDLKKLMWKDPKKPVDDSTPFMKVMRIRQTDKGRCTTQLQRKSWGRHLAKEECAFAVVGRERTVDLEAATEVDRDKWCRSITLWVEYMKAVKKAQAKFNMNSTNEN